GLRLPYDVPANEYVNMEAQKISTSRNWVINLKDAVSRYDPDPLRFALSAIMPETSDSNFTWDDFVRRNNDELVATFGNLVNRVLSMISRNFEGEIPSPTDSGKREEELFQKASETLGGVSDSLMNCRFREALGYSMALAQFTNRYLDEKAPWAVVKTNPDAAGTTLYTAANIINCLKVVFHPFLPFSTEKLHLMLGQEGTVSSDGWSWQKNGITPGHQLGKVEHLFTKLDQSVVDEEISRLGIT
ncbi:MAG: methionine--tRNA ligase, partial [SAR202 cluster bacterium Ae2-Chloro-G2]